MAHNYYKDCHKGTYTLLHPEKYMPNAPLPQYKSEWEQKFFVLCDVHPLITMWGYEPPPISIAYMSVTKYLIEIKPTTYSVIPKMPKPPSNQADEAAWARYRKRKVSFEAKLMDVMVNHAKWAAAEEWCRLRGVNWFIANEKNMGRLFHYDVRL